MSKKQRKFEKFKKSSAKQKKREKVKERKYHTRILLTGDTRPDFIDQYFASSWYLPSDEGRLSLSQE